MDRKLSACGEIFLCLFFTPAGFLNDRVMFRPDKGFMMIKELFAKMGFSRGTSKSPRSGPSSVLLKDVSGSAVSDSRERPEPSVEPLRSGGLVTKKKDSAEVFQEAVDKLIDKLEDINTNLASQVQQNQQLVERMDTLPGMLSPLPKAVEEQRQAFAQVAEQLRQKVARDEKVAEHLSGIHVKVSEAAQSDAKLCETFGAFSETLNKLDHDTVTQTEWLEQMSRTFSTSERYLKHALAKQQSRFYWVLGISLGICVLAITGMVIGLFLMQGS